MFFLSYTFFFTPSYIFLSKVNKHKERQCSHLNADNVKCAWNSCIGSGGNSVADDIFLPTFAHRHSLV